MPDEPNLPSDSQAIIEMFGRLIAILQLEGVINEAEAEYIHSGDEDSLKKLKESLSDEEIEEILDKHGDR